MSQKGPTLVEGLNVNNLGMKHFLFQGVQLRAPFGFRSLSGGC